MTSSPPPPAEALSDAVIVSTIGADRFCIRCRYNLIGQSVVREDRYQLLVVRCPECGTVAGVQEYPQLGPWAARFRVILVALWLLFIFVQIPATSGVMCSMSVLLTETSSGRYREILHEEHMAAARASESQTAGLVADGEATPGAPAAIDRRDFGNWWAAQNTFIIYSNAGGWLGVIDPIGLLALIPTSLACFVAGIIWSIYLIAFRRRSLLLWGAVIVALASVFAALYLMANHEPGRWVYAWTAARVQLAPTTVPVSLAVNSAALFVGLWFGRPAARLTVRLMLPPRHRGALALLWRADDKKLPVPKGGV